MLFLITTLIKEIHPLQAEEEKLFNKRPFSRQPKFFCRHEGDGVVINNDRYQGHSPSTSERYTTTNGTHIAVNHLKLVHWNAQGTFTKTYANKTAIVQDNLDIVMIQDTRFKRRLDDLPNLRIHGYHTYHRTMDEGGHGMVTILTHNNIEGSGTNTLRRWHLDSTNTDMA